MSVEQPHASAAVHGMRSHDAMSSWDPVCNAAWDDAWAALGTAPDVALREQLLASHAEPQRHYHTLQHLSECLAWFERERAMAEHPAEVLLALWFHDAIYDVHAHDNEARSAEWAHDALRAAGAPAEAADRVHSLVMATCHDALPEGRDAALLVDIDLAILGADPERFDEYERQVQIEYGFVPDAVRRPRRRAILQRFLERPAIYTTPGMHARLEALARSNLARSIAVLG